MAQTKYTYSIATDTANAKIDGGSLKLEIGNSDIVIAVDHINTNTDVLDIFMKDSLSVNDKTTLDNTVSLHNGDSLDLIPVKVTVREEEIETGGHYRATAKTMNVPATVGWHTHDFCFDYGSHLVEYWSKVY